MGISQVEMVSIEQIVSEKHTYRKLKELINFEKLTTAISIEEKELGALSLRKDIFKAGKKSSLQRHFKKSSGGIPLCNRV